MKGTIISSICVCLNILIAISPTAISLDPLLPSLTLSMSPSEAIVKKSQNQTILVNFTGTVQVSQNKYSTMSVTINCLIEPEWSANWSPTSMQFSGSGSQNFECSVTIFANSWRQGGNLDIYTNGTTQFSGSSDYEQVHIEVTTTGNNSGREQSSKNDPIIDPVQIPKKDDILYMPITVASVLVFIGLVGYFFARKRKRNQHAY